MKRLIALSTSALLLAACQNTALSPAGQPVQSDFEPLNFVSQTLGQSAAYTSPRLNEVKLAPSGQVKIQGQTVVLELKLPPLPEQAFKTQLLDLSTAAKIRATVTDSHGLTYQPVGAVAGLIDYPVSGVISLTFNNVIPDSLLFVELQTRNGSADLPQADLATVVSHTSASNLTTTLNFQTTPTAKAMKALLSADATRARALNLSALTTLMTSITGYSAGPPATYTTHPGLVNTALLASDLASTNPGSLTAANYRLPGATVSLNVSGLVGSDKIQVQVTDAASAVKTAVPNGNTQLLNGISPGSGLNLLVGADPSNSTQYSFAVTPNSNLTLTNGATLPVTVVATPASVTISSLSPAFTTIGNTLIINGSGFSTTVGNNTVKFGSTLATVNSASATSLNVTVPAGLSGTQLVTVEVGATTSNGFNFDVVPVISGFSPTSATAGDTITLNGTGFSPTAGQNTVRFGGVTVPVSSSTATNLTLTLPNTFSGTQPVTVQVGSRTSAAQNFIIPAPVISSLSPNAGSTGDSITVTGTGFSSVLAYNTVQFGGVNATVSAASATSLTVTVPERPAQASSVTVQVAGASSATSPFTVRPKLGSLTAAEAVSGKAVLIRGQTLTIAGSNFDPIAANNTVRFTLPNSTVVTATPTAASASSLSVTVPDGLILIGDIGVQVLTNSQSSNSLTGYVPGISLDISNGGFH